MDKPTYQLLADRYHRVRMAVFSPEYLAAHTVWTDEDFTELIDQIIQLQEDVNK